MASAVWDLQPSCDGGVVIDQSDFDKCQAYALMKLAYLSKRLIRTIFPWELKITNTAICDVAVKTLNSQKSP